MCKITGEVVNNGVFQSQTTDSAIVPKILLELFVLLEQWVIVLELDSTHRRLKEYI